MILKNTPFAIQDKNTWDLDNARNYQSSTHLMREQEVQENDRNTVHHRRDLDSLG